MLSVVAPRRAPSRRPAGTPAAPGSSGGASRLGYVPALDGVRGVAIALVVAYHAYHWPVGGYLGVHVFFVLSGFLITSLLLQERLRHGRIALGAFYRRRALRLVPALVVFVAVYCAVQTARELVTPDALALGTALKGALYGLLYVSNIVQAAGTHLAVSVVHLWSLAAEEQFYLVWPLALVGILALGARRRGVQAVLVGAVIVLASYTAALAVDGASWRRLYLAPDTTFAPLMIGSLAAVWFVSGRLPRPLAARRSLTVIALAAGGVGAATVLLVSNESRVLYLGVLAVFASAVAVLILVVVTRPDSPLARVLCFRPLAYLGRISYSLYLWHLLALELARRGLGVPATAGVGLALVAAAGSYHLVELPFLRRKRQERETLERRPRSQEMQAAAF